MLLAGVVQCHQTLVLVLDAGALLLDKVKGPGEGAGPSGALVSYPLQWNTSGLRTNGEKREEKRRRRSRRNRFGTTRGYGRIRLLAICCKSYAFSIHIYK